MFTSARTIPRTSTIDAGPLSDRPEAARAAPLSDYQRLRWWCPMHPNVTADQPGCSLQGVRRHGAQAARDLVSSRGSGAGRASIGGGRRRREARSSSSRACPGCSTASRWSLGPRCGDSYPVVRGLEAGQRVAVAGAFLLDAETRLEPQPRGRLLRSGPRRTTSAPGPLASATKRSCRRDHRRALQELAPEDRPLADARSSAR